MTLYFCWVLVVGFKLLNLLGKSDGWFFRILLSSQRPDNTGLFKYWMLIYQETNDRSNNRFGAIAASDLVLDQW
jgi:hypothetical protein